MIESRSIDNSRPETVHGNSENESEDDFVEPTPRKEITSNKTWLVYSVPILTLTIQYAVCIIR